LAQNRGRGWCHLPRHADCFDSDAMSDRPANLTRPAIAGLPRQVIAGLALVLVATLAAASPVDRLALMTASGNPAGLPSWREATPPPPKVVQRRQARQRIVPGAESRLNVLSAARRADGIFTQTAATSVGRPALLVSELQTSLPPPAC